MSDTLLLKLILEVRFDDGWRYLDRCGALMLDLQDHMRDKTSAAWLPGEATPKGAQMTCPALDITLTCDSAKLVVGFNPTSEEPSTANFKEAASEVAVRVIQFLQIKKGRRFGFRQHTLLGRKSREVAQRDSLKLCKWQSGAAQDSELEAREGSISYRVETPDGMRGLQTRIKPVWTTQSELAVDERINLPPHSIHEGQRDALLEQHKRRRALQGRAPVAGLLVDTDYYVWSPRLGSAFRESIEEFVTKATLETGASLQGIKGVLG